MRAIIYDTEGGLELRHFDIDAENELEVIHTGVCGSDRHMVSNPLVNVKGVGFGHEIVARVSRLKQPTEILGDCIKVGDRVVMTPGINCGTCTNCLLERRFCQRRFVYGFTEQIGDLPFIGGFADRIPVRQHSKLFKIPEDLSNDKAVFIEIMACVVGAAEKITEVMDLTRIRRALVIGAGPAGVCAYAALRSFSLSVDLLEIGEQQRRLASSIGIRTIRPDQLREAYYSVVIDCAGTSSTFCTAIDILAAGGCMIQFGAYFPVEPVSNLHFWKICQKELIIRGHQETQDRFFLRAMHILNSVKEVDLESFIRARIALEDVDSLRRALNQPSVGKSIVIP